MNRIGWLFFGALWVALAVAGRLVIGAPSTILAGASSAY